MAYHNFEELISAVRNAPSVKRVAVAAAQDEHTLEAVFKARKDGLVTPILIGDGEKIKDILNNLGEHLAEENILHVPEDPAAAQKAVELVRDGKVDFIMKGKIQTADLLKAVVDKEKGLRTGRVMSHFVLHEQPGNPKL